MNRRARRRTCICWLTSLLAVGFLSLTATARADLFTDPTVVDFGDLRAGQREVDVVDVWAVDDPATIAMVDVVGLESPFSILDEDCKGITLQPGESCSVVVAFDAPTNLAGDHSANLRILSEDNLYVAFSQLTARSFLGARLIAAPAALDFGRLVGGQLGLNLQTTIANDGDEKATIESVDVTEGFRLLRLSSCNGDLLPGSTCIVRTAFRPVVVGETTGRLTVRWSDSWLSGPQSISIPLHGIKEPARRVNVVPPRPVPPDYGMVEIDLSRLADAVPKLLRGGQRGALKLPAFKAVATGRLGLRVYAPVRGNRVPIARAGTRVLKGQSHRLRFTLTKRGRRLLRNGTATRVKAIVSFRPTGTTLSFKQAPEFLIRPPRQKRRAAG